LAARAQPRDRPAHLAILTPFEEVDRATGKREAYWEAFFGELRRLNWDKDQNLRVTWHSSQVDPGRAADLARDVAALGPDVIFAADVRMAVVLKASAPRVSVVAILVDPLGTGIAANLARPGGNVTGFSVDAGVEIVGKRLEIFREIVPAATRIAWFTPRRTVDLVGPSTRRFVAAAGMTLIDVVLEPPVNGASFRRAFESMANEGVDSVWVATTGEMLEHRRLIADLATTARLPTVFGWRANVEAGGLVSYGIDLAEYYRSAARYVDRILRGASPGDLPIQLATKFELVVNLRTARLLRLTVPPSILARADEVIE
jgi:putative ABC transport system substrate-binding protein